MNNINRCFVLWPVVFFLPLLRLGGLFSEGFSGGVFGGEALFLPFPCSEEVIEERQSGPFLGLPLTTPPGLQTLHLMLMVLVLQAGEHKSSSEK